MGKTEEIWAYYGHLNSEHWDLPGWAQLKKIVFSYWLIHHDWGIDFLNLLYFWPPNEQIQERSQQTICWLVVWNMFYFPFSWECHHPN